MTKHSLNETAGQGFNMIVGIFPSLVSFRKAITGTFRSPECGESHRFSSVMLGRLLLLFLITPVVELALLIRVGEWIGFWPTIALIIATGLAGSFLARREGFSVWRRFNQRFQQGGLPGEELVDGMIILMAGALLITPGVLTDVFGFIGLVPLTRAPLRKLLIRRLKQRLKDGSVHVHVGGFGVSTPPHDAGSSAPEGDGQDNPEWGGTGRQVPRHADEVRESGANSEEGDAVQDK